MPLILQDIRVLVFDCQATGAHPSRGHLLEAGWCTISTDSWNQCDRTSIQAHVVDLPSGAEIPPSVQRITGLSADNLSHGVTTAQVWDSLCRTASEVAASNALPDCPTIIHFARFEEPFLRHLHEQNEPQRSFPFRILCTHEICRRTHPDLPRRGLRAMAGFLGHSVSQFRRTEEHVQATAFIWQKLIQVLQTDHGIRTLDQLQQWLAETKPRSRNGRSFPMERAVRLNLPNVPGVYRMRRSNGDLLYIGKAASLKKRVNSYFRSKVRHAEHTLEMLTQAGRLEVTRTGSALEAAVLEGDEIKRNAPPYNVALRRGERRIVFCSKDLRRSRHTADSCHRLGPLPSETAARSLAAFGEWLERDGDDALNVDIRMGSDLLGIPQAYAPGIDCLRQGLAVFLDDHRQQMQGRPPLGVITTLGRRIRRDAFAASELNVDAHEPTDDPPAEQSNTLTWNPEAVADALAQSLSRLAHLLRRSRWLCMLSESSICWERPVNQSGQWIGVIFENGCLVGRRNGDSPDRFPIPPGFGKDRLTRQQSFDVDTYDRLRIVTTELRRLVSEKRDVRVCLGPRVVLRRLQLERLLRWV